MGWGWEQTHTGVRNVEWALEGSVGLGKSATIYTKAWRRRQLGAGGDEPEWGWWETGQEGPGSLRMTGPLQLLRPERWTWMDLGFRETEG